MLAYISLYREFILHSRYFYSRWSWNTIRVDRSATNIAITQFLCLSHNHLYGGIQWFNMLAVCYVLYICNIKVVCNILLRKELYHSPINSIGWCCVIGRRPSYCYICNAIWYNFEHYISKFVIENLRNAASDKCYIFNNTVVWYIFHNTVVFWGQCLRMWFYHILLHAFERSLKWDDTSDKFHCELIVLPC